MKSAKCDFFPAQTVYQTELDKLRKQIYAVLNKTTTFEEFSALLMQEHGMGGIPPFAKKTIER